MAGRIEINKVLRKGGELFINTNHSIGLHDFPWDFWRYSETCWHGLLNEFTGFEILKTAIGDPVRITPMRYDDGFRDHEGGLGFQTSTVWARKISDSTGVWNADSDALHNRLSRAYRNRSPTEPPVAYHKGSGHHEVVPFSAPGFYSITCLYHLNLSMMQNGIPSGMHS